MSEDKYRPEFCQKILENQYRGWYLEELADELGVSRQSLVNWAARHEEFNEALESFKTRTKADLLKTARTNQTTDAKTRFYDNHNAKLLHYASFNRGINLKGCKDELEELERVRDAVARNEVTDEYAASISAVIKSKLEARKQLEFEARIKAIEEKLGVETKL